MAHKRFRECDGVRYVTNRLKHNPDLIKTISDAPRKRKMKTKRLQDIENDLNRQLKCIDKLLESHKGSNNESECSVYTYPIIDRRI